MEYLKRTLEISDCNTNSFLNIYQNCFFEKPKNFVCVPIMRLLQEILCCQIKVTYSGSGYIMVVMIISSSGLHGLKIPHRKSEHIWVASNTTS